ncbi:hypothetical protein [Actinomadura algeriensis]|uniref:Aspartate/methionine/tyrosine aminotransferase n=1 Tax=Actinomadura algeriensis TaxID=1679523 RepID=A0ABR9JNM9_9ACTN|nr:hypothetical protein [Actinomadura algeriensis]MBE1532162.1 aspartate/methionine/tyrosine aminotransferase [Actinomadura algeriensis]
MSGTDDRLAIVDEVLAAPFPEADTKVGGERWGGPGHHLCVLKASQDFWDDRSEEVVEAAEEEIEAARDALVAALRERWGDPREVDLTPFLMADAPAPDPQAFLCGVAGGMLVWPRPDGRWLAIAIGQADAEFAIMLLAAVGEGPVGA